MLPLLRGVGGGGGGGGGCWYDVDDCWMAGDAAPALTDSAT